MFYAIAFLFCLTVGYLLTPTQNSIFIEQVTKPVELGESPHWDMEKNILYFVDIFEQNIHCFHPRTKRVTHTHLTCGSVSVVVPIYGKKNTLIVGCGTSLAEVFWDPNYDDFNPKTKIISTVDTDRNHTRFNDGKVDPHGRFWAGTMGQINGGELIDNIGSLYRFNYDGKPSEILYPVSISNGLVWSLDNKTLYYADSPTLRIDAFDYNEITGDITNQYEIFNLVEHKIPGMPDGMTIDTKGNLWIAITDGGRVISINPKSGRLLQTIFISASKVNSVAFGGVNLDILYVITARRGLTEKELREEPLAGAIFAIHNLGVKGTPMLKYKMN